MDGDYVAGKVGEEDRTGGIGGGGGGREEGSGDENGWVEVTTKKKKAKKIRTPEGLSKIGGSGDKIDFEGFDTEDEVRRGGGRITANLKN